MIINLFNTNVEELNTKLANTIWQVSDVQLTVKNIYVDGWTGGYCARFIDGLDPRLLTGFRRNYPNHSVVQSLNAAHQRKVLQEMLQAAQIAEDDFLMITRVSREAVGLSQAFHATSPSSGGQGNPIVGAYPSQAELTMQRYAPGSGQSTNGSATTPTRDRLGRRLRSEERRVGKEC